MTSPIATRAGSQWPTVHLQIKRDSASAEVNGLGVRDFSRARCQPRKPVPGFSAAMMRSEYRCPVLTPCGTPSAQVNSQAADAHAQLALVALISGPDSVTRTTPAPASAAPTDDERAAREHEREPEPHRDALGRADHCAPRPWHPKTGEPEGEGVAQLPPSASALAPSGQLASCQVAALMSPPKRSAPARSADSARAPPWQGLRRSGRHQPGAHPSARCPSGRCPRGPAPPGSSA